MTVDVQLVHPQPVSPSLGGLGGWTVIRICRIYPAIQYIRDDRFRVVFKWSQKIRKHTVDMPAPLIVTLVAGYPNPFTIAALITDNAVTIITKEQYSIMARGTKVIPAFR